MARVKRDIKTARTANTIAYNIQRSMRNHNPREEWEVHRRKCDDGTWGVWVAYHGIMSDDELRQREQIRSARGQLVKRRKRAKAVREA